MHGSLYECMKVDQNFRFCGRLLDHVTAIKKTFILIFVAVFEGTIILLKIWKSFFVIGGKKSLTLAALQHI